MKPLPAKPYDDWDEWLKDLPGLYLAKGDKPDTYLSRFRQHLASRPPLSLLNRAQKKEAITGLNQRLGGLARVQYKAARSRTIFGVVVGTLTCASVPFPPLLPAAGLTAWAAGLNEIRAFQEGNRIEAATDELSNLISLLIEQLQIQP